VNTLLSLFAVVAVQTATPLWDHFLEVADVYGGRLLLILLDADGDGRQEIFLAPSTTCGNGGCGWYVYSPTPVLNQVRYLGQAAFSPGAFRFTRSTHTIRSCWHMSAADCELGEYRFDRGTMSQRSLGTCRSTSAACELEFKQIAEWQRAERPLLLFADLPESSDLERLEWSQSGEPIAGVKVPDFNVPDFNVLVLVPGRNRSPL
jgi:hypothetical protein